MIVDTSAIMAILLGEAEAADFTDHLIQERAAIATATLVECSVVVDRVAQTRPQPGIDRATVRADLQVRLDRLVSESRLELRAMTPEIADIARRAHRDFGPGSGSAAKLNFGDCFPYALAKLSDEPLLFKGDDFGHTDVRDYLAERAAAAEAAEPSEPPDA